MLYVAGNTRRAHRLMAWAAKEHGLAKQNALAEQLFEGYHCKVGVIAVWCFLLLCVIAFKQGTDDAMAQQGLLLTR
jgi:hypothetical protein